MNWGRLLSAKRVREYTSKNAGKTDLRSEFEKDYHRIIGSASFRRLQDKTQVFPLDKSDFVRTRLTHSLEVSSFARSLGHNIGEFILTEGKDPEFTRQRKEDVCSILQCAGLLHDIGNPPFGHFGESVIRDWFRKRLGELTFMGRPVRDILTPQMREDFYNFEGNAQAFRLITKLHYLVDDHGMNLTYALLNTIVKYPVASTGINPDSGDIKDKKMGFFYADRKLYEAVATETGTLGMRHPLTFILEAADDIAYKTADIEDGFVKGFISYEALFGELCALQDRQREYAFKPADSLKRKYESGIEKGAVSPGEYAVKNWIVAAQGFLIKCATEGFTANYRDIMSGTYRHDLFYGTEAEGLTQLLGELAYRKIFSSADIYKKEVSESSILSFLMDQFVTAALYYDTDSKPDGVDDRLISFISENYKKAYHRGAEGKSEAERLYLRLLLVTDYICGMTDSFAKRLYQELLGVSDVGLFL